VAMYILRRSRKSRRCLTRVPGLLKIISFQHDIGGRGSWYRSRRVDRDVGNRYSSYYKLVNYGYDYNSSSLVRMGGIGHGLTLIS